MSLSDDEESTESSGGGSYDPPSEFRSDITEAAGPGEAAGGLNIGFDTQSFVTEEPGSDAEAGAPLDRRKSRRTPWMGGEVFGKTTYRIEPNISFGGCGWVYRASRCVEGSWVSDVVIKVASKDDRAAAHEREAHIYFVMRAHENVLVAEEVIERRGSLLLVLPWASGGSLGDFLRRSGAVASAPHCFLLRMGIALQVARGLHHLHSNGLVHQDVKPGNVLLFRENTTGPAGATYRAVVSDFGLTTAMEVGDALAPTRGGTGPYMSPEQSARCGLSPASDMWSFGIILFEMLARPQCVHGRLPHVKDMGGILAAAAVELDCVSLWEPVMALISRCLASEPAERPTAAQCEEELARIISACGGTVRPPVKVPPYNRMSQLHKEARWLAFYKRSPRSALPLYAGLLRASPLHSLDPHCVFEYASVLAECARAKLGAQSIASAAAAAAVGLLPEPSALPSSSSSPFPSFPSPSSSPALPSTATVICEACRSRLTPEVTRVWLNGDRPEQDDSSTVSSSTRRSDTTISLLSLSSSSLPALETLAISSGASSAKNTASAVDANVCAMDVLTLGLCEACLTALLLSPMFIRGFHFACRRGNERIVQALLSIVPERVVPLLLAAPGPGGDNALHAACGNDKDGPAKYLLETFTVLKLVTQTSNDGSLPLHCAVASGLSATVSALLATAPGTLLAKRVDGADSLWIASQCGHDGIVRSLLLTGASPAGNEAAFAACENGNLSTLRVLFGSGVDVTDTRASDGATLLIVASLHGHTDIVHELLGMGADPDARTRTGRSSLSYAASSGFLSVARALIRGRAFLNPQNSIGETPLFIAASLGHRAVVRELIDKGADIELCRHDGVTPLAAASSGGHTDIVRNLLNVGALVDLPALPISRSPLYLAAQHGHTEVVNLLLAHGVDAGRVSAAGTALHVAAVHGHSSVCAALAASPAVNINAGVSPFGHTPLTLACERGHSHVVRVLLGLGADPNPPVLPLSSPSSPSPSSFSGHTPLEAACAGGHTGIARLLLAAGAHITEPCLLSLPSLPSLAPLPTPPPPPTPPRPAGPPLLPLSLPPPIPGDRPSALFASTEHIVPDKDDGGVSGAAPAAPGRFTLSPPRPSPSRPPTMGSGVSVEFKFVSWPCDGVQRQEHRETLRGPIIVIGRKQTETRARSMFPGAHVTFFSPRDVTVEKFLSGRAPQVCIQYSSESGFTIVALSNPKAPDTPPVNRVQCRSLRGGSPPPWTTLPLDTPFPLALADEFAISPYFGFKILWLDAGPSTPAEATHDAVRGKKRYKAVDNDKDM